MPIPPALRCFPLSAIGLTFALLLPPTAVSASAVAPVAGAWTGDFSIPAFGGWTNACAIYRGQYVVGGQFQSAPGVIASNVALWTGYEWIEAGGGLPFAVYALEPWGRSLLAATSGYSSRPGTSPVMRFDGVTWAPLGNNLSGIARAVLVSGADIYVAGLLIVSGSEYGVARFDGLQWVPVGQRFAGNSARAGIVTTLAMFEGELYAGGDFQSVGQPPIERIARFDGQRWAPVGVTGGADQEVLALLVYEGRLIAGGAFDRVGGVDAGGLAAWDGVRWSGIPGAPEGRVQALEVEGSQLHAAGTFRSGITDPGLYTFDGTRWSLSEKFPTGGVSDIASGGGALIAVGGFRSLGDRDPHRSTEWARDVLVRDPVWRDLVVWRQTMRGLRGPSYSLHEHEGELFACGPFLAVADPPRWRSAGGIARWDGSRWVPLPTAPNGFWARAFTSWNGLLITGTGVGRHDIAVLSWDGTRWSVEIGGPGWRSVLTGSAYALTVWRDKLVAMGSLGDFGPNGGVMVLEEDGWHTVGSQNLDLPERDYLGAGNPVLSAFGGDLYVGKFNASPAGALLRWSGDTWTSVPATPFTAVTALLPRNDGLWVGGQIPDTWPPGNAVSRWDGAAWNDVGVLVGNVGAFGELDGKVYATGAFQTESGLSTLVQWTGQRWAAVPGAPNAPGSGDFFLALAGHRGSLWLGGSFNMAGGQPAAGLARWRPAPTIASGTALAWSVGPNPAREFVQFQLTLARDGHVRASIYDLRGALVARPVDEVMPAGTSERRWDLRGSSGAPLRAGVYYGTVESPEGTARGRIVILR